MIDSAAFHANDSANRFGAPSSNLTYASWSSRNFKTLQITPSSVRMFTCLNKLAKQVRWRGAQFRPDLGRSILEHQPQHNITSGLTFFITRS